MWLDLTPSPGLFPQHHSRESHDLLNKDPWCVQAAKLSAYCCRFQCKASRVGLLKGPPVDPRIASS